MNYKSYNDNPVIDLIKTGENIKKLIKKAGINVADIQAVMGFNNPVAIYKWQRGESLPSIDNLIVLASILNVKIDDIVITQNNKNILRD